MTRVLDRTGETARVSPPATPWRLWKGRAGDALGNTDELSTIQAMHQRHLDALRERIARSCYEVDPQAVAAAILARLALAAPRGNTACRHSR